MRKDKSEQDVFKEYLMMRAVDLNAEQCGNVTGLFGLLLGCLAGSAVAIAATPFVGMDNANQIAINSMRVGNQIASIPGQIVGCITSPIRMFHLRMTREHRHSSDRVTLFCDALNQLIPTLRKEDYGHLMTPNEQELVRLFGSLVNKIINKYGGSHFSSSESSSKLLYHLIGETKYVYNDSRGESLVCRHGETNRTYTRKATSIISYLSEKQSVNNCLGSGNFLKNQGKKLFNIVMDIFEKDGQQLLSILNKTDEAVLSSSLSAKK